MNDRAGGGGCVRRGRERAPSRRAGIAFHKHSRDRNRSYRPGREAPRSASFVIESPSACCASARATQSLRQVENLVCGDQSRAIARAGVPNDQRVFINIILAHCGTPPSRSDHIVEHDKAPGQVAASGEIDTRPYRKRRLEIACRIFRNYSCKKSEKGGPGRWTALGLAL